MVLLKPITKRIFINNPIFRGLYKIKWYFDTGVSQVTWITGKLPELMGFVYLSEKMGYAVSNNDIYMLVFVVGISLICIGVFLKKTGLYDTEVYVNAAKNPYQHQMLKAARIIINNEKIKRRNNY